MAFTEDDLKSLKGTYDGCSSDNMFHCTWGYVRDILARLEAAEAFINTWTGDNCWDDPELEIKYQAWLKSKGE